MWVLPGSANIVRKFGMGERGAVEYFAQRVLGEADIKVRQRQTYLGLSATLKAELEALGAPNYHDLDRYVSLQDDYLNALFPRDAEQSFPGGARPHEVDQFQGVSDPDNKHYSGPTGTGGFNMDSVYWKSPGAGKHWGERDEHFYRERDADFHKLSMAI
jgi:hypothetical protein